MDSNRDLLPEEEQFLIFNNFKHYDEVIKLISTITDATKLQTTEEHLEEEFIKIFGFYQEQPHLLDPYLPKMISDTLEVVKTTKTGSRAFHFAFRVLYLMVKTRGYKSIIRLMPHTVDDIEPTLVMLTEQDTEDANTWETRYVLLLWLSILIMVPFGLNCLDSEDRAPIVNRILDQSKRYLSLDGRTQEAASFLLARLVTRPDVVQAHLTPVLDWCLEQIKNADCTTGKGQKLLCGVLRSLANICKVGRRQELLAHAPRLLESILHMSIAAAKGNWIYRFETKLLQRIGLLFCPPRSFSWQYQRGLRSLADNLAPRLRELQNTTDGNTNQASNFSTSLERTVTHGLTESTDDDDELDLEHADEVAEVIDRLINSLRNQYTVVRWSAAKGLGRMCGRLSRSMVNDVLSAILLLCTRLEPFTAWHGACLALAELGRRSLLLPSKLPEVMPVILRALFYDERSGDHSYGSNVRDAACYVCWAFARAYQAADLAPYVTQVAQSLVLVSLFDREVNVRRAAAAAFQENVGRQGQFPHGIEILTACDYFAVRNLKNCYLELSAFVAQFPEYTQAMIDHLATKLLGHWDVVIRFLSARALNVLCRFSPEYMLHSILPATVRCCTEAALYERQGNLFGTAELIEGLGKDAIGPELLVQIKEIVPTLSERNQFRGLSGELLRKASCHLIEKSSRTRLPLHGDPVIVKINLMSMRTSAFAETWRLLLDDCVAHKEVEIQKTAVSAYTQLLAAYLYDKDKHLQIAYRDKMFGHLTQQLEANSETKQSGFLQVLADAPADLFTGHVQKTLELVTAACRISTKTRSWGDARASALKSVLGIMRTLGHGHPELTPEVIFSLGPILLQSLSDYTLDSRGDIGSRVRETGMNCLLGYLGFLFSDPSTNNPDPMLVEEIVVSIVQQSVEKIDRTRAAAGQAFSGILYHEPPIRYIPHVKKVKEIFSKDECDTIVWSAAHQTFPKFVQLLDLPEYRFRLVLGLVVSVGGLTEKTVLCSTEALTAYLLTHEADHKFITEFISTVNQISARFASDERVIVPLFRFVDFLLNDPVIAGAVNGESPILINLIDNTWNETKRSADVHRIKAAINVFGGMLQFEGSARKRSASLMMILMAHKYPVIRKSAATKLYECLVMFDLVEPEVMDQVTTLLTETIWESELDEIRPIRNTICEMLGVPVPRIINPKVTPDSNTPTDQTRSVISVNGDAGDRG
ncbi:Tubulin-specific chaperone D [Fasciola hepatica]|uniref:Tubulin-specific chaperone D n=1 Tax=Fasciola hepatica TaxID=6192 RepID=A0A4E0S047_FASHE|nr:Tubulin-specific chaperone D [Fasciola hepatica]